MQFPTLDRSPATFRRPMHWMADAAAIVVLFGAMLSAWVLAGVALAMMVGLLAYAVLARDPARHWIAVRCLVAAAIAAAVVIVLSLVR